jgi:TIR domain-containing protein
MRRKGNRDLGMQEFANQRVRIFLLPWVWYRCGTMAETGSREKLKVFISYSRRDSSEFADELVNGLELAGFAPFLDRHDIAPGEKWEERLGGLIAQSDTVVFVVSPEAVKSERCAWEVEQTLRRSKRLLPVVFKPVVEADIPESLRERQFIRLMWLGALRGRFANWLRRSGTTSTGYASTPVSAIWRPVGRREEGRRRYCWAGTMSSPPKLG